MHTDDAGEPFEVKQTLCYKLNIWGINENLKKKNKYFIVYSDSTYFLGLWHWECLCNKNKNLKILWHLSHLNFSVTCIFLRKIYGFCVYRFSVKSYKYVCSNVILPFMSITIGNISKSFITKSTIIRFYASMTISMT